MNEYCEYTCGPRGELMIRVPDQESLPMFNGSRELVYFESTNPTADVFWRNVLIFSGTKKEAGDLFFEIAYYQGFWP